MSKGKVIGVGVVQEFQSKEGKALSVHGMVLGICFGLYGFLQFLQSHTVIFEVCSE